MSLPFPYTYISCPCSDASKKVSVPNRHSQDFRDEDEDDSLEEKTFNPRHPRSNFSLFPPEHLLYCEECHEIKCPRCVMEEIVSWYCPSCLFETPSSMVRSEGNRCARNCFNCPICTSQLVVTTLTDARDGPWILNCNYCMWTSLEIGIKFDKPTNIRTQLSQLENGGKRRPNLPRITSSDSMESSRRITSPLSQDPSIPHPEESPPPSGPLDPTLRFHALRNFYRTQLSSSVLHSDPSGHYSTLSDSPSSLARIVNLYSNLGVTAPKSYRLAKTTPMREALTPAEGLLLPPSPLTSDPPNPHPWPSTPTSSQLLAQNAATSLPNPTTSTTTTHPAPTPLGNPSATTLSQLRPLPTLLRTKRAKRCAACAHILVKPETKPTSVRWRIKLSALSYIPLITIRRLPGAASFPPHAEPWSIEFGKPAQFLLRFNNPLFDSLRISLATPSVTHGPRRHRVTILTPHFEVGRNGESAWDEALGSSNGKSTNAASGEGEAGKVAGRGRNWAEVGVEVVPVRKEDGEENGNRDGDGDGDEAVLEVPIRVRIEWRQSDVAGIVGKEEKEEEKKKKKKKVGDGGDDDERKKQRGAEGKGKVKGSERLNDDVEAEVEQQADPAHREVAYWMVVGLGRVVGITG